MSGTDGIRIVELPDLGAATDAASVVAEKSGSGRISLPAVRSYVLNGAFPEAPMDGTAYGRVNASWTQVLPTSGGTVSGNVTVTGTETVGGSFYCGALYINPANSYEWQMYRDGSGNHILAHRPNWYEAWSSASGTRTWYGTAGWLMTLDGAGNLGAMHDISTSAGVFGGYVSSSGNLNAASQCTVGQVVINGTSGGFNLGNGGSGRILQFRPNFYLEHSMAGDGTAGQLAYQVGHPGGPLWVMRPADDFCFNPLSAVGGNGAYLNISDRRAKEGITPTTRGLTEVLQLEPVEFTRANPSTGAATEIGFVAQDVQPIVPEAVWKAGIPMKDGTGGLDDPSPTLAISEATLTALNVNAIKELHDMISALQARIEGLEAARSTHV